MMGTGAEDGCTIHDCMAGFPHGDARSLSLVATRFHLVDSKGRRVCHVAERSRTGQTPRTPAFAGRLVEILRDDGEPRSPRRPDCSLRYPGSPPSSRHSAAPPSCRAWMPGSRTRAEARQANIGRMPMVRVKPFAKAIWRRRCDRPPWPGAAPPRRLAPRGTARGAPPPQEPQRRCWQKRRRWS